MVAGEVTAFVDVNVVPMDTERVLEGCTVLVRDGRIAAEIAGDDLTPETLVRHAAGISAAPQLQEA